MATVIQEKQRSNEDRHPRWERTHRAALFDQYRELQAGLNSLPWPAVTAPLSLPLDTGECRP